MNVGVFVTNLNPRLYLQLKQFVDNEDMLQLCSGMMTIKGDKILTLILVFHLNTSGEFQLYSVLV